LSSSTPFFVGESEWAKVKESKKAKISKIPCGNIPKTNILTPLISGMIIEREEITAPTANPFIYATISAKIPKVIKLKTPATITTLKLLKNIKRIWFILLFSKKGRYGSISFLIAGTNLFISSLLIIFCENR